MIRTIGLKISSSRGKAYLSSSDACRTPSKHGLAVTRLQVFVGSDSTQTSPVNIWFEPGSSSTATVYQESASRDLGMINGLLLAILPFPSPALGIPLGLSFDIGSPIHLTNSVPEQLSYSVFFEDVNTGAFLDLNDVLGSKGFLHLTLSTIQP